jgi:hypothetical protein
MTGLPAARHAKAQTGRRQSRLAPSMANAMAAVDAGDLGKVDFLLHNAKHKAGEMALGYEIGHCHRATAAH